MFNLQSIDGSFYMLPCNSVIYMIQITLSYRRWFDQLMSLCWVYFIPITFCLLLLFIVIVIIILFVALKTAFYKIDFSAMFAILGKPGSQWFVVLTLFFTSLYSLLFLLCSFTFLLFANSKYHYCTLKLLFSLQTVYI